MSGKHRSGAVAPMSNTGLHRLEVSQRHRVSTAAAVVAAGTVALAFATPAAEAVAAPLPPDAIAQCESGGSNTAKNKSSTASGKWQFINGTWAAYGGTAFAPTAAQATEREQDIVAARAYAAEGTTPWASSKGCWGGKSGKSSSVAPEAKKPVKKAEVAKPLKKAAPAKPSWDGLTYKAPKKKDPVVTLKAPLGEFTPGGTGNYTVQNGDTLANLARDYKVSVDHLMARNDKIVEHKNWIFVGEKLDVTP